MNAKVEIFLVFKKLNSEFLFDEQELTIGFRLNHNY